MDYRENKLRTARARARARARIEREARAHEGRIVRLARGR